MSLDDIIKSQVKAKEPRKKEAVRRAAVFQGDRRPDGRSPAAECNPRRAKGEKGCRRSEGQDRSGSGSSE